MRISDWSSDVCSSDLLERQRLFGVLLMPPVSENDTVAELCDSIGCRYVRMGSAALDTPEHMVASNDREAVRAATQYLIGEGHRRRSEEHTSELQSLMRISYAVFCSKKKICTPNHNQYNHTHSPNNQQTHHQKPYNI